MKALRTVKEKPCAHCNASAQVEYHFQAFESGEYIARQFIKYYCFACYKELERLVCLPEIEV